MDEIKAKQQVVDKIKGSSKILVTVSKSPSVDALSAALGLALLLDKKDKYATAIFSGETPPAIAFLEPEKTFDDTTDSLRDFIIALNKEKADHLRYKVEGDSVKIFVTPYKTTITEKDLEFSQGDYNVELVIALGVDSQSDLDSALANHGQILHDAAIVTISSGDQVSNLGGTDWHDPNSSSLSEMVAGLAEAMKDEKSKSLLDAPIATALLTGIVAQTDRFSNEHTTSKTLTVAASLMNAGADQQLIVSELLAAQGQKIEVTTPDEAVDNADTSQPGQDASDGSLVVSRDPSVLSINHEGETLADLERRVLGDDEAKERVIEEVEVFQEKAAAAEEGQLSQAIETPPINEIHNAYSAVEEGVTATGVEPTLGGTLSATADQAADDARREAESDQNKTILTHSYLAADTPTDPTPPVSAEPSHSAYAYTEELPMPPPIPDFSQLSGVSDVPPPAIPLPPTEPPAILGDILAPEPVIENTTNIIPDPNSAYAPEPATADPGQFQIPSQ